MTNPVTEQERSAFYSAAVLGLRALDASERTARRFGADADTRWTQFAGSLGAGDRLDIMLRDAAGMWGAAFSPSECFGLFGLAADEPFGPDWGGIDDQGAKRLLAETSVPADLVQIGHGLGVKTLSVSIAALTPSTKLVVAGGAAIISVAKAFSENTALSWTDQVVVLADKPAWRQLAGLAAVVLGARGRTVIVRPGTHAEGELRASGFAHLDAAIVSADAEPEATELAHKVGKK